MMLKQSPSRNPKSKGFKVKHVLQICVLLAICIWLLYQVKHSHVKKAAYEGSSTKLSEKVQSGHDILQIGRKGLHPRVEETTLGNEKRGEEIEHEEGKLEERAEEEEYEQGEDLIDEQDEEREEGSEEQENEEKENLVDDTSSSEDWDQNIVERNSHEVQEEHYKRDDASGVVVHNAQTISTETERIRLRKVKAEEKAENAEKSQFEQENLTGGTEEVSFDEKDSDPRVGEDETTEKNAMGNAVGSEEKGYEFNLTDNTSSTLMQVETHGSLHETDILPESFQDQNVTFNEILSITQTNVQDQNENSTENGQSHLDSRLSRVTDNSDTARREMAGSSFDSKSVAVEWIVKLDATEESSASTTTNENDETDHKGNSSTNAGSEEAKGNSAPLITTEAVDAVQIESFDFSDSSFHQENREAHAYLVTLPETELGTRKGKDAAE